MPRLLVAAIARQLPGAGLAADRHTVAPEGEVGEVAGAAFLLALAALAVVAEDGIARDLIADRAAGTAAGIGLAHGLVPSSWVRGSVAGTTAPAASGKTVCCRQCFVSVKLPRLPRIFCQPLRMFWQAASFRGTTKPACTSFNRVPLPSGVRVKVTTVSSL